MAAAAPHDVMTGDDAAFREVLRAEEPVLVLFTASWCPFCVRFQPIFDELAPRFRGRIAVASLEEDSDPRWDEFGVQVVPTVAVFHRGRLIRRHDGILRRGILRGDFEAFLAKLHEGLGAPPTNNARGF